ncbi:TlpA disulfide reductase family protein [uncultured Butyricimonas sp.]|uniref:TlpA family protein disulfide reductase n=1 Tax=uncultured Butyricimonas sp. TaxID=1268785 RepID=UPI0026DB0466|nr:TlpA disulfide reductase family protein [uncultured Butyricimonas sp.]
MRIAYNSVVLLGILLLVSTFTLSAQDKLEISGRIRVLKSVEVRLENIEGEILQKTTVENNIPFSLPACRIVPDVYLICFGETSQPIYLTNTEVTIKGFYDCQNVGNSSLDFTGIDKYYELLKWLPKEQFAQDKTIDMGVKGKLEGNMYSALAYIADMSTYEPNKLLLDCMAGRALETASGKWLKHRADSLYHYSIGAPAYDFTFQDANGKKVSLSDFRGKLVLVDFWASWCGPCRGEMKKLVPIYNELKGDDLEFISISLDSKEKNWRKALEEEKLPWVTLWDEEGFVIGNKPNTIQRAYGFYSIPFIVLIDKEGRLLAKDLRGERVKEEILKARRRGF